MTSSKRAEAYLTVSFTEKQWKRVLGFLQTRLAAARLERCDLALDADAQKVIEKVIGVIERRMQHGQVRLAPDASKLFPVTTDSKSPSPVASIPWCLAEKAYETYVFWFGTDHSLEKIAALGGFGWSQFAVLYAGKDPMQIHGKRAEKYELAAQKRICSECKGEGRVVKEAGCCGGRYYQCQLCKGTGLTPNGELFDD